MDSRSNTTVIVNQTWWCRLLLHGFTSWRVRSKSFNYYHKLKIRKLLETIADAQYPYCHYYVFYQKVTYKGLINQSRITMSNRLTPFLRCHNNHKHTINTFKQAYAKAGNWRILALSLQIMYNSHLYICS